MAVKRMTRRGFIRTAALGAAVPYIVPASALGQGTEVAPSERLTMGCIGIGGMGTRDLSDFLTQADVHVVAVCDVDTGHRDQAKTLVDTHYDNEDCAAYNDFREVLARDDIDTVLIATPDHWHALIAIEAAKAGKDMYCEKPISLTIAEGRAVVQTMERHARIYQSGTQRRSIGCFRFAVEVAWSGMLGRIHTIHTLLDPGRECPPQTPRPVPAGFDYDRWLGPAPYEPYTPLRCHGSFRWIYDYSGGQLTDIGAHFNDLAQWGNGTELGGPVEYDGWAEFPREGLFDTPIHFGVEATYANGVKLLYHDTGPRTVRFEGDEGWVSVDDDGNVNASPESILRSKSIVKQSYAYWTGHHRNFLDCVKTRNPFTIARPEVAQRSTTTCHIGNLCLRLGRRLRWDLAAERFIDDPAANALLSRAMRAPWHL
ncbi:MAG TPA: Gfo/Idh/MocA family oxidoreductase [Candidatus Hydrogenedentes bacterium]|nr:Gfo/Idh/MocA family oxidoreductase [Candidatus Hydrogenedentota bacterium]HPG70009.1 Gfo/Idh/MocA family oxidoreductase [Candidatus Hydrogenedentota bacterium]